MNKQSRNCIAVIVSHISSCTRFALFPPKAFQCQLAFVVVFLVSLLIWSAMTRHSRLSFTTQDDEGSTTTAAPASKVPEPSTFSDGLPLPKMIVFDLDYTLWPFWVDTHVTGPLKATKEGLLVKDRYGESYGFYSDVAGILTSVSGCLRPSTE